ncbi:hypothetical protein DC522_20020 [Microvirga sp. KLBC 81]|uniref:hypothetical protein n=1 Tax=Microvirga sp. KLBC 81 TaxID=1862707 RepID=UPI000D5211E7|nr:hypothetical protein [Microvirga sp. KLBC 81]PVE22612.1 hypothetical protein DC522_20020 [Microvirga sp. KLBC 81]
MRALLGVSDDLEGSGKACGSGGLKRKLASLGSAAKRLPTSSLLQPVSSGDRCGMQVAMEA